MKSDRRLLLAVGLIGLLAGVLAFKLLQHEAGKPVSADSERIDLRAIPLSGLDGGQVQVGDWQGKLLVVNLWAPWCAPCRREIPALIELQRDYLGRGVHVLGIAIDGETPVREFASEYGINYPLFLAGNRSPMYNAAFGNPSGSLPFTLILDRELEIRFQHNGEVTREMLQSRLDALLNPRNL